MAPEYPGARDWDSDGSEDDGTMLTMNEYLEYGDHDEEEGY